MRARYTNMAVVSSLTSMKSSTHMAMIVDAARRYSSTMRAPAAHGIVWAVVFPATSLGPHTNRLYPIHSSLSRLVQEWRCFSTGTPADFMADLDGLRGSPEAELRAVELMESSCILSKGVSALTREGTWRATKNQWGTVTLFRL